MQHNSIRVRSFAALLLGSILLFGCDDDEGEDVVLPDGQVVYTDLDVDGDGFIDQDEYDDYFDDWDLDDDGFVEPDEWFLDTDFAGVDTNGDGQIDEAEYDAAFTGLDADGDGFLSASELGLL